MSYQIIYVIRHAVTGLHKIGITNNWERRKRQLEVGAKTTPVHVARVNDARQVEKFLHKRFASSRIPQTEWFHLDEEQLGFVRSTILKAKDDYNSTKEKEARGSRAKQIPMLSRQNVPIVGDRLNEQKVATEYIKRASNSYRAKKQAQGKSQTDGKKSRQNANSAVWGKTQSQAAIRQRAGERSTYVKLDISESAEARKKMMDEIETQHLRFWTLSMAAPVFAHIVDIELRKPSGMMYNLLGYFAIGIVALLAGAFLGFFPAMLTSRFSFYVLRNK